MGGVVNRVYGPWRVVNSAADVLHVAVNEPKPSLVRGYWADDKKNKIVTKDAAKQKTSRDAVYAYISTIGIPDGTPVALTLYEWDPTFFNPDDYFMVVNAVVKNNCIHHKIVVDEKWYSDESDKISEIYFEAQANFTKDGTDYELSGTYPEETDDYLFVTDRGVLITVIIKLPLSTSTEKWEGKGLGGHTAIAIGQEFYDFGPNTNLYDDDHGPINGVAGIPWWDKEVMDNSSGTLTRLEDVDLPQVIQYIKKAYQQDIFTIEFYVTSEQAKKIESWWLDRYKNLGTYACMPWTGEQCTTTVRISLENAGVIPWSAVQAPSIFLDFLRQYAKHTAGAALGKPAKITQIQHE